MKAKFSFTMIIQMKAITKSAFVKNSKKKEFKKKILEKISHYSSWLLLPLRNFKLILFL